MSTEAQSWAHHQICGNVARKAVLMALASWADASGFVVTVLFEHLEQATELSRTGVYARLRELEAGGVLTRERGHHPDGRTVSARLNLEGCFSLPGGGEISRKGADGRAARAAPPTVGRMSSVDRAGLVGPGSLGELEAQCRALVGSSPAAISVDFSPIARLVAEGASEADVLGGIRAAMALRDFRPRSWAVFERFIRRERVLRASVARSARPGAEGIVSHRMRALKQIHDEGLAEEEARNG
jgi:hypothetical protein